MSRLILLIALVAVVLIAITALLGTIKAVAQFTAAKGDDLMPDTFRRVAYVVLIVLLIGLSTGWLGAA